jgi:putative tryptophan/tyrosine transport system substrate-binding protein
MSLTRRDFITLIGSAAAWPALVRAQQAALPLVGYLELGTLGGQQSILAGFAQGLAELGFVENRNVKIDYRFAGLDGKRLPAMAADLVRKQVAVIFAGGGLVSIRAARAASATIPIVFRYGGDPVRGGLVASLNRPGANLTGVTTLLAEVSGKRLDLMHALVPGAMKIAYLYAPGGPGAPNSNPDNLANESLLEAARALHLELLALRVTSEDDLSAVFGTAVARGSGAVILAPGPLFLTNRKKIVALAVEHKLPVMSFERAFAEEGGLISYGASVPEATRIAATYVARILKGEKPADLPVQQATKFDFVVNLKAAKAIGLVVPETFLLRTDDVIE